MEADGSATEGTAASGSAHPRRPRRNATWILIATVVVAILVGARARDVLQDGTRVAVIGDSITAQSSFAIEQRLRRDDRLVAVAGVNGATIGELERQISSYTAHEGAEVMVVAAGTNNAHHAWLDEQPEPARRQAVEEIHATIESVFVGPGSHEFELSVDCLVWVNLKEDAEIYDLDSEGPRFNEALRNEVTDATHDGHQVIVADWAGASRAQHDWFFPDGLHPNPTGQRAYAELIAEAVDSCDLPR